MVKKLFGMSLAAALLLGCGMTVCAEEEAPVQTPPVQNYQQMMTPEILASFEGVSLDDDLSVLCNSIIRRTDVWGELEDADGDGIDDRDPINGCGYIDLNYNGFDDRFEMALLGTTLQNDPMEAYQTQLMLNLMTHRCKHGVIASTFEFDDDVGIWSAPDYYDNCPDCKEEYDSMEDILIEQAENAVYAMLGVSLLND